MTNLSGKNLNSREATGPKGEGRDSPITFSAYPEYKDSGVEWLGEVPKHWSVCPIRALVEELTDKNSDNSDENYLSLMANVGVIPYADKGDVGNKKPDDLSKCKRVDVGDLVINSMNYGIGSYGLSALKGVCSPVYIVLRPLLGKVSSRYALRVFEDKKFQGLAQSYGQGILAHRAAIGWEDLKNIKVPLPPTEEQDLLAAFLDHETTRIDALIEEQKRLIELLNEKRQAVISHAVTKGLDPAVPMKDSGVEWLGEVPAHWGVVPLGLLACQIQTGPFGSQLHSHEYVESGVPVINPSSIVGGRIVPDKSSTVTQDVVDRMAHQKLSKGDIVVGRRGEMGRCAVVSSAEEGWLCGTGSMKIVLNELVDPEFISMFIRTPLVRRLLQIESVGSTMDNLNPEILSRVRVPVPPVKEQHGLVERVRLAEDEVHRLISEARKGSELLQERRSALISAAVTGKIDVRHWQPEQSIEQPELPMVAEAHATYS